MASEAATRQLTSRTAVRELRFGAHRWGLLESHLQIGRVGVTIWERPNDAVTRHPRQRQVPPSGGVHAFHRHAIASALPNNRSSVYDADMTKQAMQEPTFLILTALAGGAQHGYGIMTDVTRISDGRVKLRAGTLYAALDRLLGDGIVGVDREEIAGGRLRRYYRLTPAGAELLAAEAARLSANARIATARLRKLRIGGAQAGGAILAGGAA